MEKDVLKVEIVIERDEDGQYEGTDLFIDGKYERSSILYSEIVDYLYKDLSKRIILDRCGRF